MKIQAYTPQNVTDEGSKIWFGYLNKTGRPVTGFYDKIERKFKTVVQGRQYGKYSAIRNLVAQPVVTNILK